MPKRKRLPKRASRNSRSSSVDSSDDEAYSNKRTRVYESSRQKLPARAVEILRKWLLSPEHFDHPYPSPAEKDKLARECNITNKYLVNWLTNARKRLWQPLRKKQGKPIVPYAQAKSAKRLEEISAMSQQAAGGAPATSPASWLRQYPSIAGLGTGSASTVATAGAERSPPSLPLGARGPGAAAGAGAGAGAGGRGDMHSGASTQLLPSVAEDPQQLLENLRSEARDRCKGDRQRQELHMQMRLSEIQQYLQADREQLLEQLRSVEMQSTALQKAERLVRSASNRSDVAETLRMLSRAVEQSEGVQADAAMGGTASSTAPSSAGAGHGHGHGHGHHRHGHGHGHRHGLDQGHGHPSLAPAIASNSGLHQGGAMMLDIPSNGMRHSHNQDLVYWHGQGQGQGQLLPGYAGVSAAVSVPMVGPSSHAGAPGLGASQVLTMSYGSTGMAPSASLVYSSTSPSLSASLGMHSLAQQGSSLMPLPGPQVHGGGGGFFSAQQQRLQPGESTHHASSHAGAFSHQQQQQQQPQHPNVRVPQLPPSSSSSAAGIGFGADSVGSGNHSSAPSSVPGSVTTGSTSASSTGPMHSHVPASVADTPRLTGDSEDGGALGDTTPQPVDTGMLGRPIPASSYPTAQTSAAGGGAGSGLGMGSAGLSAGVDVPASTQQASQSGSQGGSSSSAGGTMKGSESATSDLAVRLLASGSMGSSNP